VPDDIRLKGYKPYIPDAEKPATQIYVETPTGEQMDIGDYSKPVRQLCEQQEFLRYYFPEDLREQMEKIAN